MIRRPPRSTLDRSSAASDVYKRQNQDAVAFMIKLPFLKFFTLGYSYDITTSRLRVGGANTHELILGIYPCAALDPSKAIVRFPIFE